MRATSLILASVLSLGTIASATATGSSKAGTAGYNCTNQAGERSASHESASTGGDTLNLPRPGSNNSSATTSRATGSGNTDENATHFGGSDATSSGSAHSSGLGWQSLLPGSIQ
jgi:hypothetical protein